jgi:O-antigen ligase
MLTLVLVWYRAARQRKFLLLVGSIGMICVLTFVLPAAFWQRAGSIVPAIRKQEDTFGARLGFWRVALRMVEDRPIVGVGPGNYVAAYPRYARSGDHRFLTFATHNAFVGVAAETGVVGLALFLLISGLALRNARRAILTGRVLAQSYIENFGVVAEVCLLAILMAGLSGNVESLKCLWMFFGLALAMGRMTDRATSWEGQAATRIAPAISVDGLGPWVPARPRQ